jgi:hypothetical protein
MKKRAAQVSSAHTLRDSAAIFSALGSAITRRINQPSGMQVSLRLLATAAQACVFAPFYHMAMRLH